MIEVTYCRDKNQVTVKGHAQSGEFGHDLVCAAVSALVLTLSANVVRLYAGGFVTEPVTRLEPGNAEIRCIARDGCSGSVQQVFMSLCLGFEILAEKWPDYVAYAVGNGNF